MVSFATILVLSLIGGVASDCSDGAKCNADSEFDNGGVHLLQKEMRLTPRINVKVGMESASANQHPHDGPQQPSGGQPAPPEEDEEEEAEEEEEEEAEKRSNQRRRRKKEKRRQEKAKLNLMDAEEKTLVNCESGETAYQAIERGLAKSRRRRASKPYEVPDTCPNYDSSTGHRIQCESMPSGLPSGPTPTGKVFKFELHVEDCEPVAYVAGKQRNEIKVWGGSPRALKGYFGTTMRYTWSFFVDSSMRLSRKFTHIMQIKGVGGDAQMPFVTFTGYKDKKGNTKFQIRRSPYSRKNPELLRSGLPFTSTKSTPWSRFAGHWVTASVEITMKGMNEGGRLKVDLKYADGTSIMQMDEPAGLWRAANEKFRSNDYLRPKWGIYRRITDSRIKPGELNDATVYFANLGIESLTPLDED